MSDNALHNCSTETSDVSNPAQRSRRQQSLRHLMREEQERRDSTTIKFLNHGISPISNGRSKKLSINDGVRCRQPCQPPSSPSSSNVNSSINRAKNCRTIGIRERQSVTAQKFHSSEALSKGRKASSLSATVSCHDFSYRVMLHEREPAVDDVMASLVRRVLRKKLSSTVMRHGR